MYETIRSQLSIEAATFRTSNTELADYILPRRTRYNLTDVNKGDRRNSKIIDSTASKAVRTLVAGMVSGLTSPANPWFELETDDQDLNNFAPVKDWLYKTKQVLLSSFARSNLYKTLPVVYGDASVFASAAMIVEEDFTGRLLHTTSVPVGSYMFSVNRYGIVDTFFREYMMTVRQMVEKFAEKDKSGKYVLDNFSTHVKDLFQNGNYESWVTVCHIVRPNELYNENKLEAKFNKKYSSCYYEKGSSSSVNSYRVGVNDELMLKETGYSYFPVLCPRWSVTGEDSYGTSCPGLDAIGDIKALQLMHIRKAEAVEKTIYPHLLAPTALKKAKINQLPGRTTFVDVTQGSMDVRPLNSFNGMNTNDIRLDIQDHQRRIKEAFYEDLFLMISESDRRQQTATEVAAKNEEKLIALGPTSQQFDQDLLNPLIDIAFDFGMAQGVIPTPPEELQGMPLKVKYTSILARAQKIAGISSIERFTGFVGNMVSVNPAMANKVDFNKLVEHYGEALSVPPGIIRSTEEVQAIEMQQQQAQQQQQAMQMMQSGAQTAKTLADTDTEGDNALTNILKMAR